MSTTEAGRHSVSGKPDSTNRDGVSLQAVIDAPRRLDELSCARVVAAAAEAVHAAQKGGHPLGTVTPAAIRLLPDGAVRLAEGPASPRYSAPETLRGGTGDRRTDVFALGVVLWEALAHERLFDGPSDEAITQAVLGRAIRSPSELNANVPAELDAICQRALARDPAGRYHSARVMAAEIDAVLGDAGYPESNEAIAAYLARAHGPLSTDTLPGVTRRPTTAGGAPGSQPIVLGSPPDRPADAPAGPPPRPATRPGTAPGKAARTEILGSLSSERPATTAPATAPAQPGVAVPQSYPIVSAPPAAPPRHAHPLGETQLGLAPPPRALHPQPPKPSIANADTLPTPHLTAELSGPATDPQLVMPPGMTVAPSTPPAPLYSSDLEAGALAGEHHTDPAEVVALPHSDKAGGGRDLLAGWGWTTDSLQAIDDHDSAAVRAAMGDRRRLLFAIGGALGVVLVIVILAFAFAGGKPGDRSAVEAKRSATPSATAPTAPSEPANPQGTAPGAVPQPPSTAPATPESGGAPSTAPATPESGSAPSTAPAAEPPKVAAPVEASTPPAAAPEPPREAKPAPAPAPPAPEPVRTAPPAPKVESPRVAARTEPTRPEVAPPEAAKPEAAKPDAKKLDKKAEPRKPAELRPETRQPEPRKPAERAFKRPPPDRLAKATPRAQPVDPYATADKAKPDPAEAYKTGLQQYARGDTAGALATFRSSLAANPRFAPTWRGLGLVFEKLGDKSQARSAFRRYLQLAPTAGDADQIRDRMERLGS